MKSVTLDISAEPKRRSRTRAALIEAAKRLLSRSSVNGFTIDDVIREADVARGTFYNHFTSIDALVAHTVTTVQEDLYACISEASVGSPDAASELVRGTATVMRYGYANLANARVLMYVGPGVADPHATSNRQLTGILNRGLAEQLFKFPSLEIAVVSVIGICEVGLSRMMDLRHEYTAVRELTFGLCITTLRCVGVDARRIDRLARDAVLQCFEAPLGY